MTDAPLISVVVSTYQRARLLPRLLRALEEQTLPLDRFEVVIANNGSRDETAHVLAELSSVSPLRLRIIDIETNRGPAAGRNLAWRAATGDVLAFTDDDCVPRPEWLERGTAALQSADVVIGRTVPAPDQIHRNGPFSRTMDVSDARFFQTCNAFYRRADLEAVGGFDEGFPTPGGEDTDLGWRVEHLGRRVLFAPDAIVEHDVSPSRFRPKVRETLRWWAIPRLIALHGNDGRRLLYRRYFWKHSHPLVIPAVIGLAAAWWIPYTVALGLPWAYYRLRVAPLDWGRVRRFVALPGAFVIDVLEVATMIRGSIKFRVLVL